VTNAYYLDSTATVSATAKIGDRTKIWINCQIREDVTIGSDCVISKDVYVDRGVTIGSRCKIQNGVSIYNGVSLEDDVFIGPHVAFTNDLYPRAFSTDWQVIKTVLRRGASVGANATIVCGIEIGEFALIAAGSVVTKDVEPYTLVMGNPAQSEALVNKAGRPIHWFRKRGTTPSEIKSDLSARAISARHPLL
jgi:acetyltransferase-like isoleucine patch superfamily enzyme